MYMIHSITYVVAKPSHNSNLSPLLYVSWYRATHDNRRWYPLCERLQHSLKGIPGGAANEFTPICVGEVTKNNLCVNGSGLEEVLHSRISCTACTVA